MFFEETVRPRVSDADRGGRLSCEALLRLLEDVGTHHSAAVSDGVIENRGDGIIWVLVEWRLKILRRPADRETLTVATWAMGQAPSAFIRRGYTVTDGEGREVLLAEGKFALFNSETGRPVRIDESMFAAYRPEERDVFASPAPKLRPLAAYRAETPFALRRDDIDFNGHVHNTRYVTFALEALPRSLWEEGEIESFRLVYTRPVREGDGVTLKYGEKDGKHIVGVYVGDVPHALAEFRFEDKNACSEPC